MEQASLLLCCIIALVAIIATSLFSSNINSPLYIHHSLNISAPTILQHTSNLLAHGEADSFEDGRRDARDYIKNSLQVGGIPEDQIFWHYFEWKEKQEGNTLLWSGYNILVWLNNTAIPSQKVRVFGSHYDTFHWGKNSTSGASTLAGSALMIETAVSLHKYQDEQKKMNSSFEEVPYLFIFFDHHEPGALGSKALASQLDTNDVAYFIAVSSIGYTGSSPILHTLPYDHSLQSVYTPDWLASLFLRAGMTKNVPIRIGSRSKIRSLLYQAYRYHWHAVSLLSPEGPFSWKLVPSSLLSDNDVVFDPNPHYRKATDQIWNINEGKIKEFSNVLSSFILASHNLPRFSTKTKSSDNKTITKIKETYPTITKAIMFIMNGVDQYLGVGIFIVNFVEIASLSFVIIAVVCFHSAYEYRKAYTCEGKEDKEYNEAESESDLVRVNSIRNLSLENENEFWQGHKILIVHMLLMGVAVMVDTVFAFEMLILGFLALSTIHFSRYYINVVTGFLCSIFCVNLLYRDIIIMSKICERTRDFREIRLIILLTIYLLHSAMLLVYGFDYNRKKAKLTELDTNRIK